MGNSLYGNVWHIDTAGIISKTPIWLRGIMFYPNTQADAILLNWWDEGNPIASSEMFFNATASSGTVTETDDTNPLTSTLFPATGVVRVLGGSGTTANHTYHLIGAAGNDHRIIIDPTSTWADEGPFDYHTITYPARVAIRMIQPADTNQYSMWVPFPGPFGFRFPNLVLETISATCSAQLYLT